MNISDGEKLILLMLSEIYDRLDIDGEIDPDFIRSSIFSDNTWSIPWKYVGIPFQNQETPDVVKEVLDILDMWSRIEYSYSELTQQEKQQVEIAAKPFGKNPKFPGFDGNNETEHMGAASFLVNELDRFIEFKGRNFNSHFPSLDMHKRMLAAYEPIARESHYAQLTAENLIKILNEMTHPENR